MEVAPAHHQDADALGALLTSGGADDGGAAAALDAAAQQPDARMEEAQQA